TGRALPPARNAHHSLRRAARAARRQLRPSHTIASLGQSRERRNAEAQRGSRRAHRSGDHYEPSWAVPPPRKTRVPRLVYLPGGARPPAPLASPAAAGSSRLGSGCACAFPLFTATASARPKEFFSWTLWPSFSSAFRVLAGIALSTAS